MNTRSSTGAELVGLDDVLSEILWTKRFLEEQGFEVKIVVVSPDNTSSMKLEQNGRETTSKRTRHFKIKYFYATDLIKREEFVIEYCPTKQMKADYMSRSGFSCESRLDSKQIVYEKISNSGRSDNVRGNVINTEERD